jgi:hypothetical protein
MREIKFRARMTSSASAGHEGIFVWMGGVGGQWRSRNGTYYGNIVPGSEEQFTGLHDKNGKEIYEGDILDFDEREWGGEFTCEVVPSIDELIGEWPMCGTVHDINSFRAVIGNIHENPELLANNTEG